MRSTRLVTVHAACRLLAVVLGATVALAVAGSPASAHGQLAVSNPVAGATLSQPTQTLELYFTEAPALNAYFTVTAPSGVRVDAGWQHGPDKRLDRPVTELFLVNGKWEPRLYHTGYSAFVKVAHWPEKGEYTVSYLSVASDRETVRGTVKFSYSGPPTAAPQGWTPPTNAADPALLAAARGTGATGVGQSGQRQRHRRTRTTGDGQRRRRHRRQQPRGLVVAGVVAGRSGGHGRPGGSAPARRTDRHRSGEPSATGHHRGGPTRGGGPEGRGR